MKHFFSKFLTASNLNFLVGFGCAVTIYSSFSYCKKFYKQTHLQHLNLIQNEEDKQKELVRIRRNIIYKQLLKLLLYTSNFQFHSNFMDTLFVAQRALVFLSFQFANDMYRNDQSKLTYTRIFQYDINKKKSSDLSLTILSVQRLIEEAIELKIEGGGYANLLDSISYRREFDSPIQQLKTNIGLQIAYKADRVLAVIQDLLPKLNTLYTFIHSYHQEACKSLNTVIETSDIANIVLSYLNTLELETCLKEILGIINKETENGRPEHVRKISSLDNKYYNQFVFLLPYDFPYKLKLALQNIEELEEESKYLSAQSMKEIARINSISETIENLKCKYNLV